MRKTALNIWIPSALTTLILSFSVLWVSSREESPAEVEQRAYEELETAVETRREYLSELLEGKFAALESLSYYFGTVDASAFPEERAYADAAILANHYSTICLVDLSGNACSWEGEKLGNVVDCTLFREASARKGQRAVQYMEDSALGDGAGFYAAAPIRSNNVLTGILCAGFEPEELDHLLVGDGFGGRETVFVTDSAGNILLQNNNARENIPAENFFAACLTGDYSAVQGYYAVMSDLNAGKAGHFRSETGGEAFGSYAPLGLNDWFLFSMTDAEAIRSEAVTLRERLLWGLRAMRNVFLLLTAGTALWEAEAHRFRRREGATEASAPEEAPLPEAFAPMDQEEIGPEAPETEEIAVPDSPPETAEAEPRRAGSVFARTFGYFDLFVDSVPVHFTNPKEKELLAILVDRNGGTLTAEEAIGILWEDEPSGERQITRYRKLASRLKSTLTGAGCGEIVVTAHGVRHLDVSALRCDYFEALRGNGEYGKKYQGVYMINYSWAEETTAALNRLLSVGEDEYIE